MRPIKIGVTTVRRTKFQHFNCTRCFERKVMSDPGAQEVLCDALASPKMLAWASKGQQNENKKKRTRPSTLGVSKSNLIWHGRSPPPPKKRRAAFLKEIVNCPENAHEQKTFTSKITTVTFISFSGQCLSLPPRVNPSVCSLLSLLLSYLVHTIPHLVLKQTPPPGRYSSDSTGYDVPCENINAGCIAAATTY